MDGRFRSSPKNRLSGSQADFTKQAASGLDDSVVRTADSEFRWSRPRSRRYQGNLIGRVSRLQSEGQFETVLTTGNIGVSPLQFAESFMRDGSNEGEGISVSAELFRNKHSPGASDDANEVSGIGKLAALNIGGSAGKIRGEDDSSDGTARVDGEQIDRADWEKMFSGATEIACLFEHQEGGNAGKFKTVRTRIMRKVLRIANPLLKPRDAIVFQDAFVVDPRNTVQPQSASNEIYTNSREEEICTAGEVGDIQGLIKKSVARMQSHLDVLSEARMRHINELDAANMVLETAVMVSNDDSCHKESKKVNKSSMEDIENIVSTLQGTVSVMDSEIEAYQSLISDALDPNIAKNHDAVMSLLDKMSTLPGMARTGDKSAVEAAALTSKEQELISATNMEKTENLSATDPVISIHDNNPDDDAGDTQALIGRAKFRVGVNFSKQRKKQTKKKMKNKREKQDKQASSIASEIQTRDNLYMVMEFAQGGDLFTHLHRDGPFLESRGHIKIVDFGLARAFTDVKESSNISSQTEEHGFVPTIASANDVSNFDDVFTSEMAELSGEQVKGSTADGLSNEKFLAGEEDEKSKKNTTWMNLWGLLRGNGDELSMTDSQFDQDNKTNVKGKRAEDPNLGSQSSQNQNEDQNLFANFDGFSFDAPSLAAASIVKAHGQDGESE
eukprot:g720.t1